MLKTDSDRLPWAANCLPTCSAGGLGFDFDGATFSHIGERVMFKVRLASFGLENDPAPLARRAGTRTRYWRPHSAEGVGFDVVLVGASSQIVNDDQLASALTTMTKTSFNLLSMVFLRDIRSVASKLDTTLL